MLLGDGDKSPESFDVVESNRLRLANVDDDKLVAGTVEEEIVSAALVDDAIKLSPIIDNLLSKGIRLVVLSVVPFSCFDCCLTPELGLVLTSIVINCLCT